MVDHLYCNSPGPVLLLRFEHCKPAKNEELPTPQMLPLPSVSLAGPSDPEPSGPTPGPGAQDWVNAAEFVPGQPYCGRGERPPMITSRLILIHTLEHGSEFTLPSHLPSFLIVLGWSSLKMSYLKLF